METEIRLAVVRPHDVVVPRALHLRSTTATAADEDVAGGRSGYDCEENIAYGPQSDGGRGDQPSKVVDVEGGVSIQS